MFIVKSNFTEEEYDVIRRNGSTGVLIAEIKRLEHLHELQRKELVQTFAALLKVSPSEKIEISRGDIIEVDNGKIIIERFEDHISGKIIYSLKKETDASNNDDKKA